LRIAICEDDKLAAKNLTDAIQDWANNKDETDVYIRCYAMGETTVLACNMPTKKKLLEQIQGIMPEQLNENKMYYLVPKSYLKLGEEHIGTKLYEFFDHLSFFCSYDYDYEVIFYKSANVIAIDKNYTIGKSAYEKNPIIVFNNLNESELPLTVKPQTVITYSADGSEILEETEISSLTPFYFDSSILYQISETELQTFLTDRGFQLGLDAYSYDNAYEAYADQLHIFNQMLTLYSSITLLIVTAECLFILFVLKLHFSAKGLELIIRKSLGDSIYARYRFQFISLAFEAVVSAAAGYAASLSLSSASIPFILAGITVFYLSEFLVLLWYIRKTEKTQMQKILKGGTL